MTKRIHDSINWTNALYGSNAVKKVTFDSGTYFHLFYSKDYLRFITIKQNL